MPERLVDSFTYEGSKVSVGDRVIIKPSSKGKRDGFEGVIKGIRFNEKGTLTGIDVTDPNRGHLRCYSPTRCKFFIRNKKPKGA